MVSPAYPVYPYHRHVQPADLLAPAAFAEALAVAPVAAVSAVRLDVLRAQLAAAPDARVVQLADAVAPAAPRAQLVPDVAPAVVVAAPVVLRVRLEALVASVGVAQHDHAPRAQLALAAQVVQWQQVDCVPQVGHDQRAFRVPRVVHSPPAGHCQQVAHDRQAVRVQRVLPSQPHVPSQPRVHVRQVVHLPLAERLPPAAHHVLAVRRAP